MLNNCRFVVPVGNALGVLTHQMSAHMKSFFIILANGALANASYGDSL